MLTDNFQLSPAGAEARFQLLQRRRQRNPDADDPLFRPIDADDFRTNGESASDFSNLRENGLVRISFPLPANIWLVDPATNQPSDETDRGRVADGPDRQRCPAHGPRRHQSLVPRPQRDRRIPVGWPRRHASGAGARGAARITRRFRALSRNGFSTIWPLFSVCCSRTPACARSRTPSARGRHRCRIPIPRSTSSKRRARSCSSAPAPSATADPRSRTGTFPHRFDFTTSSSQCPRPIDTRPIEVVTPARFAFAACPPRLARNARTYEIALSVPTPSPDRGSPCRDQGSPDQLRSRSRVPDRVRWRPSAPGRLGQIRRARHFAESRTPPRTSTTTARPRWKRWSTTTSSCSSSSRPLALPGLPPPPVASTDGINFDRQPRPEERAALLAYLRKL